MIFKTATQSICGLKIKHLHLYYIWRKSTNAQIFKRKKLNQRKNDSGLINSSKNQINWQEKATENSQMDYWLSATLVSNPCKDNIRNHS